MKKSIIALICAALTLTLLAGCAGNGGGGTSGGFTGKTTSDSYPIETDQTLQYWVEMSGHVSAHSTSLNDTPFAKALIEHTGIGVEFIHPPAGSAEEKFNLMISSNELPDIIEYSWEKYSGGPSKAIEDGVILGLNDIMAQVSPNVKAMYDAHPDIKAQMQTDDGELYVYPFMAFDPELSTYIGPMVRGDLIEKAGLELPETIADWDNMLRTFKSMGVEVPLTLKIDNKFLASVSAFLGAYGITGTFYVEDDIVKFGPYEEKFRDYVEMMTGWYADGLLDSNFTDTDSKRITAIMGNGDGGSAFGSAGGDFGSWIPALASVNPDAWFVPVQYPVMNKGDYPFYGQKNKPAGTFGAAITADSANIELAARLLDYGFSDEGHMLYNFGIEGESYNIVDGTPTYTEIITDPEANGGLGIGPAMGKYIRACYNGPFVQDKNYIHQFYSLEPQKKALEVWPNTDALKYMLPTLALTVDENKEYSKIMLDVDKYREEVLYKTISGKTPLSEFDEYYKVMKERGIERALEIQQAAYDRYKAKLK